MEAREAQLNRSAIYDEKRVSCMGHPLCHNSGLLVKILTTRAVVKIAIIDPLLTF